MSNQAKTRKACCTTQAACLVCPVCRKTGRRMTALTLDHHVPEPLRGKLGDTAGFCSNAACDVVYFDSEGTLIRKGETVLPVTIKDPGDEVLVCYCFDFRRSDIRRDLQARGATTIPEEIKNGVREGRCDCERKNPQGTCCLGNVADTIKAIQAELKSK